MAISEKLKTLVDQMPNPDGRRMYTENIDKEKIEKTVAQIALGGRENFLGLIALLGEPGSEADVKPHYALHCVGNHMLITKNENGRREFCDTLASQLENKDLSIDTRAYLCQELQWAGRRESVDALGKLLTDETLCDPAAMALTAIQEGAAGRFREAWENAKGRCRLAILDGLAALADPESASIFREALTDPDREIRLAAGAGLARLGDATAADALMKAADTEPGWERIKQAKHCLVLAEELVAAGRIDDAHRIYTHLRSSRSDPSERYLRDAAEKALADK